MEDEGRLELNKEGRYLYITRKRDGKQRRYDLARKEMQRPPKSYDTMKSLVDGWKDVQHQYQFFKDYRFGDISFKDEAFSNLLRKAREAGNYESVSSFITALSEVLHLQQYEQQGVEYEYFTTRPWGCNTIELRTVKRKLSDYDKNMVKFFKKYNLGFTIGFEERYFENPSFWHSVADGVDKMPLTDQEKSEAFSSVSGATGSQRYNRYWNRTEVAYQRNSGGCVDFFEELVDNHGYDHKALIGYVWGYLIPYEAFETEPRSAMNYLRDYYDMASNMGRSVDKYPKYIKSVHDMIQANYNALKKDYDEVKFKKLMDDNEHLAYKADNKYEMIIPKESKDILREGTDLSHCVASYLPRILSKTTLIVFLREKKKPENSLVTVEIRDGQVVQARGARNRNLYEEEQEFLEKYCRVKKLALTARC